MNKEYPTDEEIDKIMSHENEDWLLEPRKTCIYFTARHFYRLGYEKGIEDSREDKG